MAGPTGSTPRLSLPYPIPDDTVDVPRDIKALAEKLDTGSNASPAGGAATLPVLDVGMPGQIRAGRELAVSDFTGLGLSQPIGLWNLSAVANLGSDARPLVNKGTVPFGVGVNGLASTAAVFAGASTQALYIADTGAADPLRIKTGSWGCWVRTAKRAAQDLLTRQTATLTNGNFRLVLQATGNVWGGAAFTAAGFSTSAVTDRDYAVGLTDVSDDRWHHIVCTFDGDFLRLYVDGLVEAQAQTIASLMYSGVCPFNIGGSAADSGVATTNPCYGRVDEAFVTADVLSEAQVRCLYAARLAHGLAVAPTAARVSVHRRRKGAALATSDFATAPVRLHNFTAGALTDEGTGNVAVVNNGTALAASGADGLAGGAFAFTAGASQSLSSTDAGLPSALAVRSYGCWFKTTQRATGVLMGWGTATHARLFVVSTGELQCDSGADRIGATVVGFQGQWHQAVVVEDNAAGDGVKRKLYLDGRLVAGSTVLNSITPLGANRFRIGADVDNTQWFVGMIDGAFVCQHAMTALEVATLHAKGSQDAGPSPVDSASYIERFAASSLLFIGDLAGTQDIAEIGVSA